MGQYTIKDIESRAVALKNDVDNIYRALNDKLGSSPETLDQVPEYIMSIPDLPTEEPLTITPTIDGQEISALDDLKYNPITVEPVTAAIDENIASKNIKEGVTILGVTGTLKGEKPEETFNVQPTTAEQIITPTEGSVFSGGTVHAVTSAIDNNIQPENIKQGVNILGVAGTLSGGGGSDVFVVPPEMRFAYSTFTEIPSNYDFREFSNVTNASYLFYNCSKLTTVPLLDLSSATNVAQMFSGCKSLVAVPELDISSATEANSLFSGCSILTAVPALNISNATSVSNLFVGCKSLVTVPELGISSARTVAGLFDGCSSLITIPRLDTSKATSFKNMLSRCTSLTTVEGIDFSGLTDSLTNLFGWNPSMSKITQFIVNGKINVSISDDYCIKALPAIDYDSVKSILAAADRTDNTNAKELAFNRTMTDQNGELAALVSSCTSKGWTISGLTLQ